MKKIMFNDKFRLTEAVLTGNKTMTRRIINDDWLSLWGNRGQVTIKYAKDIQCFLASVDSTDNESLVLEPRYKVGEIVAVAQKYSETFYNHNVAFNLGINLMPGWNNKMFVSAAECKHRILIMNIRVERLQDISDEDCMREGVEYTPLYGWYIKGIVGKFFTSPRSAFATLIDKISSKGTWDSNPYVFVYEFKLIK